MEPEPLTAAPAQAQIASLDRDADFQAKYHDQYHQRLDKLALDHPRLFERLEDGGDG